MHEVVSFLSGVNVLAFAALIVAALVHWARNRGQVSFWLTWVLIWFGLAVVVARAGPALLPPAPLDALLVFLLMAAAISLGRFRDRLIAYPRIYPGLLAVAGSMSTAVLAAVLVIHPEVVVKPSALSLSALAAYMAVWTVSLVEPAITLWRISPSSASVQRRRVHALVAGLGLMVVVLVAAVIEGLAGSNDTVQAVIELATLFVVPFLYSSFSPPAFLRAAWRAREEALLSGSIRELLLHSTDALKLAERALDWSMRLTGTDAGFVGDGDAVIASRGVDPGAAAMAAAGINVPMVRQSSHLEGQWVAIAPWEVGQHRGCLGVVCGPAAPFFGQEELQTLAQYAASFAVAMERVRLSERVAANERELERRVAERTDRLQSAIKEVEAFSYTVSHDLRQPIRAIQGFSNALTNEFADQLSSDARRYLQNIMRNSERMSVLVDSLLDFSRLNRQVISIQEVDPTRIAKDAVEALGQPALECDIEIQNMPHAEADPALLERVYSNLIGNAVKFSRGKAFPKVWVGAEAPPEGGETVYFVRDNGAGFDMRYQGKLFQVFQRLHRDDEFEGTGAGLAIAHRIVERHGGRMWAVAELGEGATFYFTLPGSSDGS